jgi:hypothetical protein
LRVLLGTALAGLCAAPAAPLTAGDAAAPFVPFEGNAGIDAHHYAGRSPARHMVEINGSGGGFLDYDGDGHLDVYLLDGAPLPETPAAETEHGNRLYRNDGKGRFAPVPGAAGLDGDGYGFGIATGDVDNDGDTDVFVTSYGPDALFLNDGAGRFVDVTGSAGVGDPRWNTSATFLDYDLDGALDLYVTAYLDYRPETYKVCRTFGIQVYCGPDSFEGIPDRLYRNAGGGRFEDVSGAAGISAHAGKGLGVVAGDIDDDGDTDLYVANDGTANLLFVNELDSGRAVFREDALFFGAAYGPDARAEAGMGTDMGDFDGDGDLDIVCTNLDGETNSLYRNDGEETFVESSYGVGLGAETLPWLGFGVRLFDYDTDGDLDMMVANGHITDNIGEVHQGKVFEQHTRLYANEAGRFREVCPGCLPKGVGRGLATADVDDDGDLDVLVTSNGGAPVLLENVAERRGAAVGLRLEGNGTTSNRDAYGARVRWSIGGREGLREVGAGGSYLSSHDPRLLLAVPRGTSTAKVRIRWPDGEREERELAVGAYHRVVQGRSGVESRPFGAR